MFEQDTIFVHMASFVFCWQIDEIMRITIVFNEQFQDVLVMFVSHLFTSMIELRQREVEVDFFVYQVDYRSYDEQHRHWSMFLFRRVFVLWRKSEHDVYEILSSSLTYVLRKNEHMSKLFNDNSNATCYQRIGYELWHWTVSRKK
jgi:hypothetical protein